MQSVNASDFISMPWKNGGGTTLEIYKTPQIRISMATVDQSGPFSHFPGKDRILFLLEGKGFILNHKIRLEKPLDRYEFVGEKDISCELIQGTCIDFNIMTERKEVKASAKAYTLKKGEEVRINSSFAYFHKSSPEFLILNSGEEIQWRSDEDQLVIEIYLTVI